MKNRLKSGGRAKGTPNTITKMEYCIPKLNRTETVNLEDRRQGLIDFEII